MTRPGLLLAMWAVVLVANAFLAVCSITGDTSPLVGVFSSFAAGVMLTAGALR